jgi:hypothetical protein
MRTYRLGVNIAGKWERVCEIEADSHNAAFRKAMLSLKPTHFDNRSGWCRRHESAGA